MRVKGRKRGHALLRGQGGSEVVSLSETRFSWIPAYEAIADAVSALRGDSRRLASVFASIPGAQAEGGAAPDPFTFFTAFNRGSLAPDRGRIVASLLDGLGVQVEVPADFAGLPTANHELWQYFDATPDGAAQCWELFERALSVADADKPGPAELDAWGAAFDAVHAQEHINKANLTRALYWVRPRAYLPLGGKTRPFIHDRYGVNPPYSLTGRQYLRLLREVRTVVEEGGFPEIAAAAWQAAHADAWWPPEGDFDPCLAAGQIEGLWNEEGFFTDDMKTALARLHAHGGAATPEELARGHGKTRDFYSEQLQAAAAAVCARIGSKGYKGSMWPVLFLGRAADEQRAGDYVWKMREPLSEALSRVLGE